MIISNKDLNNNEKLCYIYKHIRLDTNEVFYIGKGTNVDGKYARAYSDNRTNPHWHNVVNKHGYDVEIIIDNISEKEAFNLEQYYISFYGRRDKGTGTLVNLTDGGEGGLGHIKSDESMNRTKKTNLERYGHDYGLSSSEIKEKSKQTNLDRRGVEYPSQSEDVREKIKQENLRNYGVENVSQNEAIKQRKKESFLQHYGVEHGLQADEVIEKCKQTNLEKYGVDNYSKTNQFKEMMSELQSRFLKKVGQYKDGILIREYPSVTAVESEGFKRSEVSLCCNGHRKSHRGFQWKFLENTEYPSQNKKVGKYKDGILL
jgi:hypothetical protein